MGSNEKTPLLGNEASVNSPANYTNNTGIEDSENNSIKANKSSVESESPKFLSTVLTS